MTFINGLTEVWGGLFQALIDMLTDGYFMGMFIGILSLVFVPFFVLLAVFEYIHKRRNK